MRVSKRILLGLGILLFAGLCLAQVVMLQRRPSAAAATRTYLLSEGFEGAGYENAGWSESGSPDEDYTTSPAPLDGSQSLSTDSTVADQFSQKFLSDVAATQYWYFMFRVSNTNGGRGIFFCVSNSVNQCYLMVLANGGLRLFHGSQTASTAGRIDSNSTYHAWITYAASNASTAFGSIEVATSATRTNSGDFYAQTTSGRSISMVNSNRLRAERVSGANVQVIFDKFRYDTNPIGSNPQ